MKQILVTLLLIFSYQYALSCGPFDRLYIPEQYYTFRVCGDNMEGIKLPQLDLKQDAKKQVEENCLYWAKQTSMEIPVSDIKAVVYHWDYEQLEQLYTNITERNPHYSRENAFADWLTRHHDLEAISYLLLAKRCEMIRNQQVSEWYYPVDGDDECSMLMEVMIQAKAYGSRRFLDRYTLQMIRCLISMRQYDECLNLWIERNQYFQEKVIRNMAKGYVAGALFHLGEVEKAKEIFIEVGDICSYLFCLQKDGQLYDNLDLLLLLYEKDINDERIFPIIQNIIHGFEALDNRFTNDDYNIRRNQCFRTLNKLSVEAISRTSPKYLAAWHYTAAYTYDKLNNSQKALNFINQASKYKAEQDLKDAIRVFHLYLTAKNAPQYDSKLENYLYGELLWLDDKIASSNDFDLCIDCLRDGFSFYYWNDMMSKIVISQVVPKCISSGYKVRALQFLNYADYRLLKMLGDEEDSKKVKVRRTINGQSYHYEYNAYDYRTNFFINLDSIGVKYIKRLVYRMKKPLCPLDCFLYKYSYNDMNYLYEIIGTQLIASMRYKEAIQYLALVSDDFIKSRNIYAPFEYDAFSSLEYNTVGNNRIRNQPGKSYKLDFARKMYALEQSIKNARNLNDKAEFMLEYARGLQNSIGHCWKLTSYYEGCWICYPFYSRYQINLHDNIFKYSEMIRKKAFLLFTDTERAACALYKWNMCEAIVARYPDTKMAEYVRGHCDELADYKGS